MGGSDLFGAAVRTVGLVIAIRGLYALCWGFVYSFWPHSQTDAAGKEEVASAGQHFFVGIILALFGAFLLTQAEVLVGIAYR